MFLKTCERKCIFVQIMKYLSKSACLIIFCKLFVLIKSWFRRSEKIRIWNNNIVFVLLIESLSLFIICCHIFIQLCEKLLNLWRWNIKQSPADGICCWLFWFGWRIWSSCIQPIQITIIKSLIAFVGFFCVILLFCWVPKCILSWLLASNVNDLQCIQTQWCTALFAIVLVKEYIFVTSRIRIL